MSSLWREAADLIKDRGLEHREQPFKLASGELSNDYMDGKFAVDNGTRLSLVSRAIIELASREGMDFTCVGGLTMGADALTHGIALLANVHWFSVRKEPKSRGREQWIEGSRLTASDRVLLVDDVVTTGGSILLAYERVVATGASVVGVIPMVDRGDIGIAKFQDLGIPYRALVTYTDLGIEPVHGRGLASSPR